MTNFIFKSSKRLIKNASLTEGYIMTKLETIQLELRHQRQDNKDIKLMLNKLLIDKQLQTQVDEYFTKDEEDSFGPDAKQDLDWLSPLEKARWHRRPTESDKERARILDQFTRDLNKLLDYMDSTKILNHTYQNHT